MHRKRPPVVRDRTGLTGLAILRAIVAGERDPGPWAALRPDRGQRDDAALAQARPGQWREAPRFAVAQAVALSDISHQQSAEGDRRLEAPLGPLAAHRARQLQAAPRPRPPKRTRHQPGCEGRRSRHRMTGVDLTAIEGMDDTPALVLVSELGCEMSRWPTVKPCASWLGWCPHPRVSGGTVLSRRTQWCANRAATALRLAASCLQHRQRAWGAFFRRMESR